MCAQSAQQNFDHTFYLSTTPPTNLTRARAHCAIVIVEFDVQMSSLVKLRPDED